MKNKKMVDAINDLNFILDEKGQSLLDFLNVYKNMVASGLTKKRENTIAIDYNNRNSNFKN